MSRRPALLALAALAVAAPQASAHTATAACLPDGSVAVTPDYGHLSPVIVIGPTSATVTWRDGFTRTIPLPSCTQPAPDPVPAPVPPDPEATPAPVEPPPVVTIPTPTPTPPKTTQGRARLLPATSYRVVRAVACTRVGGRAYSVVRIRVVWKRSGVVVKTREATITRPGRPCRVPAVTG